MNEVLEGFYNENSKNNIYGALDILYSNMGPLLDSENYSTCDLILKFLDLDKIKPEVWFGVLTLTLEFKYDLKNRVEVYKAIHKKAFKIDPEIAKEIERLK